MKTTINPEEFMGRAGLLLCTKGHGQMTLNGQTYSFAERTLAIVSPILMYSDIRLEEDCDVHALLGEMEILFPNAIRLFNSAFPVKLLRNAVITIDEEDYEWLLRRLDEIEKLEGLIKDNERRGQVAKMYRHAYALLLPETFIMLLAKYYARELEQSEGMPREVQVVSDFVLSLIKEGNNERKVAYYAQCANLSVGHFSTLIRKSLGRSPQQWIEMITINKAKSYLAQRQRSIKQIAQEMGFPEQFTFRKYFKEHAGMSPTEYRQGQAADPRREAVAPEQSLRTPEWAPDRDPE